MHRRHVTVYSIQMDYYNQIRKEDVTFKVLCLTVAYATSFLFVLFGVEVTVWMRVIVYMRLKG